MKNIFIIVLLISLISSCSTQENNTNDVANNEGDDNASENATYQQVWADEFDYEGLPDSTKWTYDVGGDGWGNNELQYYTEDRLKNARVEDGHLIIEAHQDTFETRNYSSARLLTRGKQAWRYGRFEIRAKLPSGTGTWPAIWMLPEDWAYGGWPESGEIDIMEHVGFEPVMVYGSIHTDAYNHVEGTQVTNDITIPDAESEYHTYEIEWTPERITWYVDGEQYGTFSNKHESYKEWPFDQDFHLILNIAVGGNWGGQQGVDESIWPQQLVIDYVRVYQKQN